MVLQLLKNLLFHIGSDVTHLIEHSTTYVFISGGLLITYPEDQLWKIIVRLPDLPSYPTPRQTTTVKGYDYYRFQLYTTTFRYGTDLNYQWGSNMNRVDPKKHSTFGVFTDSTVIGSTSSCNDQKSNVDIYPSFETRVCMSFYSGSTGNPSDRGKKGVFWSEE